MNGLEQRVRHMAVQEAERQLADLSTVVQELDGRIVELAGIVRTLDQRQVALSTATRDAFALVDRSVGQLHAKTACLAGSTVWTRLRWIAVGR
jgi:hypothetical protein